MRKIGVFVFLAVLLFGTAACTAPGKPTDIPVPGDATADQDTGTGGAAPFELSLTGEAEYSCGRLSVPHGQAESSNTGSFSAGGGRFRLSFTVEIADRGRGAVCFFSAAADDGFGLAFNQTSHKVTLYRNEQGSNRWNVSKSADVREGVPFGVVIDAEEDRVRVRIGDASSDPLFDLRCDRAGDLVFFDCGKLGGVSFYGFEISEVPEDHGPFYQNPVTGKSDEGADPFIMCFGGKYYLYSTNAASEGYRVKVSEDLVTWTDRGFCLRNSDVYGEPTPTASFWAPEVYQVKRDGRDRFMLLYTVNEHIGAAFADSPEGPFRSESDSFLIAGHKAIDATLFIDDDGKSYLYYVGFGAVEYGIWGCEFDPSTLKTGPEKLIIRPDSAWETREGSVTEGPAMLKHKGRYYLTYSGNGYTSKYYAIGYAVSDAPLGTFVKAAENPILERSDSQGVYGPGHHGFFRTPGGALMLAYHRHQSASSVHPRVCCIDRAIFVDVGEDHDRLVILGPTVTRQKIPD